VVLVAVGTSRPAWARARSILLLADTAVAGCWLLDAGHAARRPQMAAFAQSWFHHPPHQFGLRTKAAVGLCRSRAPRRHCGTYPSASPRLCRFKHSSTKAGHTTFPPSPCTITGTCWPTAVSPTASTSPVQIVQTVQTAQTVQTRPLLPSLSLLPSHGRTSRQEPNRLLRCHARRYARFPLLAPLTPPSRLAPWLLT
jgi:hypothetical protein